MLYAVPSGTFGNENAPVVELYVNLTVPVLVYVSFTIALPIGFEPVAAEVRTVPLIVHVDEVVADGVVAETLEDCAETLPAAS